MSIHDQARAEAEKRYNTGSVSVGDYLIMSAAFIRGAEWAATRTRDITTTDELDALPVGSVVMPACYQTAIQRTMEHEPAGLNWSQSGDPIGFTAHEIPLPARVLYEPQETP